MARTKAGGPWVHWMWLAAGVIVADQITKAAVVAALRDGGGWPVTSWFNS